MQIIALGDVNYDIGGPQVKKIIAWGYVKSSKGTRGVHRRKRLRTPWSRLLLGIQF